LNLSVSFANALPNGNVFLTWKPVPVTIKATSVPTGQNPVVVTLTSTGVAGLVFRSTLTGAPTTTLAVTLTAPNYATTCFVAGAFGSPSVNLNDARVTATATSAAAIPPVVGQKTVTVRIRKNANTLSAAERDRFLLAYARLNNSGLGLYQTFRDMHTAMSSGNIHGGPQFLPWHRAFVLDIERELQLINPMVTMPYWRFDALAPNVFNRNFMGGVLNGSIDIAPTNPLIAWRTDGVTGITRMGSSSPAGILSEASTLALGTTLSTFNSMEGNPHGSAHVSMGGFISNIAQAVRDPLFFLLHCNVDRLWAKWQFLNSRYNPNATRSYPLQGLSTPPNSIARRTNDKMWPWDGVVASPRPPTAPGGPMQSSPFTAAPGPQPLVRSMIDYQGKLNNADWLAFDYDDVPF
jgi:tyrosinase